MVLSTDAPRIHRDDFHIINHTESITVKGKRGDCAAHCVCGLSSRHTLSAHAMGTDKIMSMYVG